MPQQSDTVCRTGFALERGLTFPRKRDASENNCITTAKNPSGVVKNDAKGGSLPDLIMDMPLTLI